MARTRVWIDPRLIVGIILVIGSLVGVWWLVAAAGATTGVWAAKHTLLPGAVVHADDLELHHVRLGESEGGYFAHREDPSGSVVVTTVREGELVPRSALGDAASAESSPVVVQLEGAASSELVAGAVVELWATTTSNDGDANSRILADRAVIVDVLASSGIVTSTTVAVEVLVPRSVTSALLETIAEGASIGLVPVAITVGEAR